MPVPFGRASSREVFLLLLGSQVKVKNTFLDDVVDEEALGLSAEPVAHTWPECSGGPPESLSLRREESKDSAEIDLQPSCLTAAHTPSFTGSMAGGPHPWRPAFPAPLAPPRCHPQAAFIKSGSFDESDCGTAATEEHDESKPEAKVALQEEAEAAFRRPRGGRHRAISKLWCHLYIDAIMRKPGFDLNKKVIGTGGGNTRKIFDATGAKIRLRGKGSGHREMGGGEAPVHLMLAITTDVGHEESFTKAVEMAAQLLQTVAGQYIEFCRHSTTEPPKRPLFWIGEISSASQACLCMISESLVKLGDSKVPLTMAASKETTARLQRQSFWQAPFPAVS
mmetsp:Transcript_39989/g.72498  ORF Transcript_39989/g.72498 Transcript_39989/m.72498 type:complete len:337 (-) Transcript_39989:53-1063(-)